jgi:uncharacterized SAM-binding protein YcdF (DUF218 family)
MLSELKPFLAALVLPPAAPLLMLLLGLALLMSRRRRSGTALVGVGTAALWLLSCTAVGLWLNQQLLPSYAMADARGLQSAGTQAIVVMGGGIEMDLPDGVAQLSNQGLDRLRQGVQLSRATGIPLMFTGGKGWGTKAHAENEADVAARVARDAFGVGLKWHESNSRDTRENAVKSYGLLAPLGVTQIALVTHSWHMPRSLIAFQQAGFTVVPAPMGQPTSSLHPVLDWLPSPRGLDLSHTVLREKVALWMSKSIADTPRP